MIHKQQLHLIEYINCIVCGKEFPKMKTKRRKNGNPIGVRQFNSKTCSTKCSKENYRRSQLNSSNKK